MGTFSDEAFTVKASRVCQSERISELLKLEFLLITSKPSKTLNEFLFENLPRNFS
jgi:hypothetical protein